jgi:hypothetical protein
VDQAHPSSIPNILLELIAEADDSALQELTPDEYERLADADKTIVRLGKAKRGLVRTVLTKDGKSEDDWRGRLAPSGRDQLARGDLPDDQLRVRVALREMRPDELATYRQLDRTIGEAWETYDDLMRLAMQRKAGDEGL